jgi:hypothetical protein
MEQFSHVVGMELKKAFCSKKFLFGMCLLLLFSILSAVYMIESRAGYNPDAILAGMKDGKFTRNPDLALFTFYNSWMGGDDLSLASSLFYTLLPVGAALPFGWSYYLERKTGYLKNIYTRVGKGTYLAGKTIAVFLSGATVVAIGLVVNVMLVFAKIPVITPFAGYNFYNHIYFCNLWADLYFSVPWLYVLLFCLLDVFYGGVFALLTFAMGFFFCNIFAVLFTPFLLMLIAGYLEGIFFNNRVDFVPVEWVPTLFLHPQGVHFKVMGWAVALVTVLLLAFSLLTIYFRGVRCETI